MTPSINGVIETSLYVADLERSAAFYARVLGFPLIYDESERMRGLAVDGRQVLLLFKTGASTEPTDTPRGRIPPHDGRGTLHLAFAISADEVEAWRDRLREGGVAIESEVECPRGGHSIYFRDPDGHLVELISPGCWSVY